MSLNITAQNNNNNDNDNGTSTVLDLESLSAKYKNLLIEYKFAVLNYVNFLKQEADTPCGKYSGNSKGIDQGCYNEVWKKAGCGSGTLQPQASWAWQQTQTLNELIQNSFIYGTRTDYNTRMQCYGNPGNPYIIIGVGTNGYLYSRQGLDAPWERINDNSYGCTGICTMSNGQGLLGIGGYNIYTKTSYTANWQGPIQSPCCVMSVAQGQDGSVVGVGLNNVLWSKPNLNGNWTMTNSPNGEWLSSICIAPDGSIFCIGSNQSIFKKNSYKSSYLTSNNWEYMGNNTCCVKAITIAPDGTFIGVGTDNQLYTKPNYKTIANDPWSGPYNSENSSCCVVSITTVANPNYNVSNYNTSSQPNYNINQQPMSAIKGSNYWGTTSISQNSSSSLQECQASCASTNGCTGATFNQSNNTCWLRGGEGTVIGSSANEYAIVPKGKQLLSIVQNINQQLTSINEQIQNKTSSGQGLYDNQTQTRKTKTEELIAQFLQLTREREKIEEMVNEYQTLDQAQNAGNIKINQNYYSFFLLLALVIIIVFILYNFLGEKPSTSYSSIQSGGKLGNNAYYMVFGIIFVILLVHYSKNFMNF